MTFTENMSYGDLKTEMTRELEKLSRILYPKERDEHNQFIMLGQRMEKLKPLLGGTIMAAFYRWVKFRNGYEHLTINSFDKKRFIDDYNIVYKRLDELVVIQREKSSVLFDTDRKKNIEQIKYDNKEKQRKDIDNRKNNSGLDTLKANEIEKLNLNQENISSSKEVSKQTLKQNIVNSQDLSQNSSPNNILIPLEGIKEPKDFTPAKVLWNISRGEKLILISATVFLLIFFVIVTFFNKLPLRQDSNPEITISHEDAIDDDTTNTQTEFAKAKKSPINKEYKTVKKARVDVYDPNDVSQQKVASNNGELYFSMAQQLEKQKKPYEAQQNYILGARLGNEKCREWCLNKEIGYNIPIYNPPNKSKVNKRILDSIFDEDH